MNSRFTFACPTCEDDIPVLQVASHIPECLRQFCIIKMKILPNCTCNGCKGIKTHPGDSYSPPSLVISSSSSSSTSQINPANTFTQLASTPTPSINDTSAIKFSKKQAEGKDCIVCSTNRTITQLNVPLIYMGKYRVFKVCKKEHIGNEDDLNKIGSIFTQELTKITSKGDHALSILSASSTNTINSPISDTLQSCSGFTNEECTSSCTNMTNGLLRINELDNTSKIITFFCSATCLCRYLTEYYCKRGTKTWEVWSGEEKKRNKLNTLPSVSTSNSIPSKKHTCDEIQQSNSLQSTVV